MADTSQTYATHTRWITFHFFCIPVMLIISLVNRRAVMHPGWNQGWWTWFRLPWWCWLFCQSPTAGVTNGYSPGIEVRYQQLVPPI